MRRVVAIAGLALFAACGPQTVVVDPAIAARATLARADANLRAGCFDCLAEALSQYESVRTAPAVSGLAAAGAVRAASLLALRERELGTTDSGYLGHARELLGAVPELQADVAPLLDLIAAMPWRAGAAQSARPDGLSTGIYRNREQRLDALRPNAPRDALSAYMFVAYACESGVARAMGSSEVKAAVGVTAEAPVVAYRLSICPASGPLALDAVVAQEPRYKEAAFYKGLAATGARELDEADARYRDAYAWRDTWPAVTLAIANVSMTAEEFTAALGFYDRTLTLAPLIPDALLGKLRALSYLAKHDDALTVADQLLALQRFPGDAYYWRAFNELQMERYDAAWTDIEAADRSLINSDVPKLAGIIAINRTQLDTARQKLELSRQRKPNDCQTAYYLHLVLMEQRTWREAVGVAGGAAACLDVEEANTRADIDRIKASDIAEARKARQIAGREARIAADARMRVTSWFNAAVGSFNLSRKDEAREFAERVAGDAQFGERARQLLERLTRP